MNDCGSTLQGDVEFSFGNRMFISPVLPSVIPTVECETSTDNTSELLKESHFFLYWLSHPKEKKNGGERSL